MKNLLPILLLFATSCGNNELAEENAQLQEQNTQLLIEQDAKAAEEEANTKKEIINGIDYYLVTENKCKAGFFGGFTNCSFTLSNKLNDTFEKVIIQADVFNSTSQIVNTQYFTFENVAEGDLITQSIANTNIGSTLLIQVRKIKSAWLTNGKLIDVQE